MSTPNFQVLGQLSILTHEKMKNVYGWLFFLGWPRTLIFFSKWFYSLKEKEPCVSCWKFCLEHIFPKSCQKFFLVVSKGGGGKKIFFHTWDRWATNIFFISMLTYIHIFAERNRKKRPRGVIFFQFLEVKNPYVQNFGFGTGVGRHNQWSFRSMLLKYKYTPSPS